MDDQRSNIASIHKLYAVQRIIDDPTPRDEAIYVPSVSPGFAIDVYAENWKRPLPQHLTADKLNFLNPVNRDFFHISHVMSSAGQALQQHKPCIITERDRRSTVLICDSGGYQIASGRLHIHNDNDRLKILRWQEKHADIAITLDVPTGPLRDPSYRYKEFRDCLNDTVEHLQFYTKWRQNNDVCFLNVLQGNNRAQADAWYDAVKKFEFEGWAFAGPTRHNIFEFCRRILQMERDGKIQNKAWIHVLGTAELETAVLLSAMQRSINKHINPKLRISYDTSGPFRILSRSAIYTLPNFESGSMTMPMRQIPDGIEFIGSKLRWPWPSPIGDQMVMSDICINNTGSSTRDSQSHHYIVHHNLAALCWGIATANRVFKSGWSNGVNTISSKVGEAVEKIDEVFASHDGHTLQKHATCFHNLRHGITDGGDEHRDVF